MSKESRQRLREEVKQREKRLTHRKKFCWILSIFVIVIAGSLIWHHLCSQPKIVGIVAKQPAPFRQPRTFKELLALPPEQLERCDIGLINLLCAEGLPGAENLDVQGCLKTLDDWAAQVKFETQRHEYRFNEHSEQFRNSYGYYRMMMLGTILVQDLGIQYNPQLALPQMDGTRPTLADGADSKNIFIHGLLEGNHLGTCASMPVLVVAIGRRLGYQAQIASGDPDLMLYRQHILKVLRKKSGNVIRIPVEVLPPPLNRGTITPAYLDQLEPLHLEDMEAIIAEFWDYYKQTTPGWMEQASLLPSW